MKKGILFLLLLSAVTANAQSPLKDALYSGKLKSDSGTVIRKGDDLSSKIDTTRKKQVEQEKAKMTAVAMDSSRKKLVAQTDSAAITRVDKTDSNTAVKDNNTIWKEYMDSAINSFKNEVLPSKKIKSGSYYVLVDYEIGPDGQVTVNNVFPSPENSFLEQQVKERLNLGAPRLIPALSGNGKPHKVIKKYHFTLTKM